MRILPGVLKELARHVPTVLFQAVDWSMLAHELPKISRRIIQKEGYADLFDQHQERLASFNILLTNAPLLSKSIKGNKLFGEKVLTLYFTQLFSDQGIFLDLRSGHFEPTEMGLKWHPTSLWTKLDEDFRAGLLKVYEGFYLGNEELYFSGLKSIGLIQPEWSEEEKKNLGSLFKEQFGNAEVSEMKFNLDHLNQSIVRLSDFMLKKKVKIPKDFLYLGIYLVGMYSTLEENDCSLPVRDIYLEVRNKFQT